MARWFRLGISVSGPFGCRCLTGPAVLRFHIPLVEPDVRISRIRLSFEDSCGRPRDDASLLLEPDQAKHLIEILGGEA